jgi:hypothetical protein
MRFRGDYNFHAPVVGAPFGIGVIGNGVPLAQPMGNDQITLIASLYQVAADRVGSTLREIQIVVYRALGIGVSFDRQFAFPIGHQNISH